MLGWQVYVYRDYEKGREGRVLVALWETGLYGLKWIDDLVKAGQVADLGGDGYPNRYQIGAGVFLKAISGGLPANNSPMTFGEDYVLPRGWNGELKLNAEALSACGSDETLVAEAWDQS
jgi:hypothetical protein